MKLILFYIPFLLVGQITFVKTFGGDTTDIGHCVKQTIDEGYIIAGVTESFGASGKDVFLIKTDSLGNMMWTQVFGGAGNDYAYSVCQTSDSGYIVAGATESYGSGDYDVWVIKTDAQGDTIWTKTYGGVYNDFGQCIQITENGYIITGCTASFGGVAYDMYLIRTDENGDTLWTKPYGRQGVNDQAYYVEPTSDSGYIVVGYSDTDVYLIKVNSLGDTLWTKVYGEYSYDYGFCVRETSGHGFIISGRTWWGASDDLYLINTDSLGNPIWSERYGGTYYESGNCVELTDDNCYAIGGETRSYGAGAYDVYFIKTDTSGNIIFEKTYGGTDNDGGNYIQQTNDRGYVIAGFTESFGNGAKDVYLIKTDSLGNLAIKEKKPKNSDVKRLQLNIHPNPFHNTVSIRYQTVYNDNVSLKVYDATGRLVETFFENQNNVPKVQNLIWDAISDNGKRLPNGIYFIILTNTKEKLTEKLLLLK